MFWGWADLGYSYKKNLSVVLGIIVLHRVKASNYAPKSGQHNVNEVKNKVEMSWHASSPLSPCIRGREMGILNFSWALTHLNFFWASYSLQHNFIHKKQVKLCLQRPAAM